MWPPEDLGGRSGDRGGHRHPPVARFAWTTLMLLVGAIVATLLTRFVAPDRTVAGNDTFYGMVVGPQVDVDRAIPKLGALGVNTVRLRMDVKDWGRPAANTGSDGVRRRAGTGARAGQAGLPDRPAGQQRGRRDAVVRAGQGAVRVAAEAARRGPRWTWSRCSARSPSRPPTRTRSPPADPGPAGAPVRRRPAQGGLGRRPQRRRTRRCSAARSPPGSRPPTCARPARSTLRSPRRTCRRVPGPGRLRRLPPRPAERGRAGGVGRAGHQDARQASRSGSRSGS